mmetsp:Transcript_85785/g.142832  ORF Transcript_85785/g.142832 Transcript_85785/m.142832 type:complete len:239 (-) Transcript_85785:605-1321(-)
MALNEPPLGVVPALRPDMVVVNADHVSVPDAHVPGEPHFHVGLLSAAPAPIVRIEADFGRLRSPPPRLLSAVGAVQDIDPAFEVELPVLLVVRPWGVHCRPPFLAAAFQAAGLLVPEHPVHQVQTRHLVPQFGGPRRRPPLGLGLSGSNCFDMLNNVEPRVALLGRKAKLLRDTRTDHPPAHCCLAPLLGIAVVEALLIATLPHFVPQGEGGGDTVPIISATFCSDQYGESGPVEVGR